jgi:hypothetical protein
LRIVKRLAFSGRKTMSEVRRALTPEDWARVLASSSQAWEHIWGHPDDEPHRMAALCLHGQPFGFTREDVKTIRWLVRRVAEVLPEDGMTDIVPHLQAQIDGRDIANRIEALLPPEDENDAS